MNLSNIVLNCLADNEKGMQQLITWFLNDAINEEVAQQAGEPRTVLVTEQPILDWLESVFSQDWLVPAMPEQ